MHPEVTLQLQRSRIARWLTVLIFLLALIQAGAIVRALQMPDDVAASLNLSRTALVAVAFVWTFAFGWAGYSLIQHRNAAVMRVIWLLIVFTLYSVLRLMIFSRADYDRGRAPILLVLASGLVMFLLLARLLWANLPRAHGNTQMETLEHGREFEN